MTVTDTAADTAPLPPRTRFHQLEVTRIRKTIRDAVVVTLKPLGDAADFDFVEGQYLTFRRDFDGVEIRRSYSLTTVPGEGLLEVGIKRVEGGAFSTWANDEMKVGDRLEAMAPAGNFHARLDGDAGHHYLGFAGGSGITPVLSLIRTILSREPKARFTLVYANRAVSTIMFREELEDLKNQYLGRLTVIHMLEEGQEIELFSGRVSQEKCAELFRTGWVPVERADMAFICGPEPMMLGIAAALKEAGLPEDRIRFELFKSGQPGRLSRPAKGRGDGPAARTEAVIVLDGTSRTIRMDRDTPILQAALDNDMDAPFACRAGVCSTCRCRVLEGEVEMLANHAIEDDEVAKGYVLSCQSYPLTDRVVVDYDQ